MLYELFSKLTEILNEEFVKDFDFWLATMPETRSSGITVSLVVSKFKVPISTAEAILLFSVENKILEEEYLIKCTNDGCGMPLKTVTKRELAFLMIEGVFCNSCEETIEISTSNIYQAYKRVAKPDVSEEEIRKVLKERSIIKGGEINFTKADSLANNPNALYDIYYSADEPALMKMKALFDDLDTDYGKNTTKKGKVLEELALLLLESIPIIKGTNEFKSHTNQFDCIVKQPFSKMELDVLNIMTPYIIVECKNEKKDPSNNYFHKLSSILNSNDAKLGILFTREPIGRPSIEIARSEYLVNLKTTKKRYLINISDVDLRRIIEEGENLIKIIEFKTLELSANGKNANYKMFE